MDGDSLNEYDLQCEEKEERDEKDIVKISECVQPFDAGVVKVEPFDAEDVKVKPFGAEVIKVQSCDSQEIVQPFDTEKLAEERVLVEKSEELGERKRIVSSLEKYKVVMKYIDSDGKELLVEKIESKIRNIEDMEMSE